VVEHVPVVLAVQAAGGHRVLRHRGVAAAAAVALRGQRAGERVVHVRDVGREAVGEGGAVGAADGVGAGERHHVLDVEPLGGEHLLEPLEAGERRRQVGDGLAVEGHAPVVAAGRHVEADRAAAAEDAGGVAAGEGDDVRARDDAGAGSLERRLGRVDHLEAAQAQVGRAGSLRRLAGAGCVQENRSVAPLNDRQISTCTLFMHARYSYHLVWYPRHYLKVKRRSISRNGNYLNEAVMEEQTNEPRARATIDVYGIRHNLPHSSLCSRACMLVVADTKP
jgi:hypothetical protein